MVSVWIILESHYSPTLIILDGCSTRLFSSHTDAVRVLKPRWTLDLMSNYCRRRSVTWSRITSLWQRDGHARLLSRKLPYHGTITVYTFYILTCLIFAMMGSLQESECLSIWSHFLCLMAYRMFLGFRSRWMNHNRITTVRKTLLNIPDQRDSLQLNRLVSSHTEFTR